MEVLGLMEQHQQLSVSEIQAKLKNNNRDLAYTTVMTVLVRLHKKGLVQRKKESRQFLYSQAKAASKVGASFLAAVHRTLFRNQKLKPILALLEDDSDLSAADLEALKKVIDQKIKKSDQIK